MLLVPRGKSGTDPLIPASFANVAGRKISFLYGLPFFGLCFAYAQAKDYFLILRNSFQELDMAIQQPGNVNVSAVNTALDARKCAQMRLVQLIDSLPARSELHIARKVWHASMGLVLVAVFSGNLVSQSVLLWGLSILFALTVGFEVARLKNPLVNEKIIKVFGPIIRTNEVKKCSTIGFFLAASILSIVVFPKPVAILALLFLSVGDPTASFFGVLFKKRSVKLIGQKSLHGSMACFMMCAAVTMLYLQSSGIGGVMLLRLSVLGGLAGAVAEAAPLEIDDNFSVPVVSGFIMWIGLSVAQFL